MKGEAVCFLQFVILGDCLGFGTWDLGILITIAALNEVDEC